MPPQRDGVGRFRDTLKRELPEVIEQAEQRSQPGGVALGLTSNGVWQPLGWPKSMDRRLWNSSTGEREPGSQRQVA